MRQVLFVSIVALVAADLSQAQTGTPSLPIPADDPDRQRYEACLKRAATDPHAALAEARAWRGSGGLPARHCEAVALLHDGRALEAAGQFEAIAEAARDRPASIRAGLLAQASRAWLELRDTARAEEVLTLAIELSPSDVELFIDRAETRVAAGELWPAIDDLNRAIDLAPRRADVYALRAAAYRYVDSLELAFDDATRAIELAPDLPDGWLERGIIHRQRGNIAGARHDWREVLLLDADGPAGEVARANIERMELKLDDAPVNRPLGAGRRR
jgi:tetratricopeptide (TPR) repeat protein